MKNILIITLVFFGIDSYAHSAFDLEPGQNQSSIKYKLIEKIDLNKSLQQLQDLSRPLEKYENKTCLESLLSGEKPYDFSRRPYLDKKQNKARRSATRKKIEDIRREFVNPSDTSFNGKLEAGWYSVNGLQTCLMFFDKKLVAIYLGLNNHNIGQDFYDTLPISYTDKHNEEHAANGDKKLKKPAYQTSGYWSHGDNGWEVKFNNWYYTVASLHYSSNKGVDEIIKHISGYSGD
jgi:hypothetical protein